MHQHPIILLDKQKKMLESYKNRISREISKAKTRQEFQSQYFPYWSQHRIIQKAHMSKSHATI